MINNEVQGCEQQNYVIKVIKKHLPLDYWWSKTWILEDAQTPTNDVLVMKFKDEVAQNVLKSVLVFIVK